MTGSRARQMADHLFKVEGLRLSFPDLAAKPLFRPAPRIEVLKGLNFSITAGKVIGIVGESGSGKSTLGRALVRLLEPDSGTILFDGADISHASPSDLAGHRRHLQMIFQDPMSSLNPRQKVGTIISGPVRFHHLAGNPADAAAEALERVGLPADILNRYPHQISGGQRQRVGIARAIALSPRFILADEIVSGLDVSSQAQIITLLEKLVADLQLTLAFISHDLSVVRRLCDRIIVMHAGQIVEEADAADLFSNPQHDYTRNLLAAIPLPEIDDQWLSAS